MGKGDRKARARRNREKLAAVAGLPALPEVPGKPKAKARGRARMAEIEQESERDAVRVVCEARARQMGWAEDLGAMRAQSHGEAAGRALVLSEGRDKGETLFAAYRSLTAAHERYCRSVLGVSPHAKTAKVEMAPERLETSADDAPPDLRTADERHRDAVNAWDRWRRVLDSLPLRHSSAIWCAVFGFADLHKGAHLTPAGQRFVEAIRALHERG